VPVTLLAISSRKFGRLSHILGNCEPALLTEEGYPIKKRTWSYPLSASPRS
jgi:hypothetical protein